MSDKNQTDESAAETESPKRGRPAGKTNKPKRENYADQLKQLRTRVGFAVSLLKKVTSAQKSVGAGEAQSLIEVAIETLEQE